MKRAKGMVYLVGAGPGDAGLLTLRGAELLGRADVVVYDALVNPDLLRLAPRTAEIIFGGKRAKNHAIPQAELNQLLVARAKAGKTVVRLKGGDPYIFGRGGEEAEELVAARIPFEVVPGISSAVAAPNYAGVPLTHREHCSSFTVITGHEDPTKEAGAVDWERIARIPGTKVIMMGTGRIGEIAELFVAHGMSKETPVAMVRWGTTGRQRSVEGTLATIAGVAAREKISAPAVAVIGDVVKLRAKLNWFEHRPLFGQRVVVTRTREQAGRLSRELLERGAEVLEIPTIRIVPPRDGGPLNEALAGLNAYDWLVFTSPSGVASFFDFFFKRFQDVRDIGGVRIAAVGPATAAKVREFHLQVDLMPEEYIAAKIAGALAEFESVENLRVLLLRAEVASADLPELLEERGAIVDDIACYRTVLETDDLTGAAARLLEEGADWITFTSSSTVENFHARFNLPALLKKFPETRTASIGPETSKALAALGFKPTIEATEHTIGGLVNALEDAQK
ncbi:MAG TPA: uroporphyrinogen-III C-methyltransferase [Candidatus Angelobacter sp.]|nr:uroporphyrinogen-III C-methyltransferase [Candidatus Angelobacter sp.]